MSLTGVHITCGYIGGRGADRVPQPLVRRLVWSETMSSAGTTTNVAPNATDGEGVPSFEIIPSFDVWVAIGPAPDATQAVGTDSKARILILASYTRNIFCAPGDKLAWVAA